MEFVLSVKGTGKVKRLIMNEVINYYEPDYLSNYDNDYQYLKDSNQLRSFDIIL
jgi:hypothetical protein